MAAKAKAAKAKTDPGARGVQIPPIELKTATIKIVGTSFFVANNFGKEARDMLLAKHVAGTSGGKGKKGKKDVEKEAHESAHWTEDGQMGIPCGAFRNAMIDACRGANFKMTLAKMAIEADAQGYDAEDGVPLVIIHGKRKTIVSPVRNATGVIDMRPRTHVMPGWTVDLRITWDDTMFSLEDVVNLVNRAGHQIGIGAGRKFSKMSAGCGWGSFKVAS